MPAYAYHARNRLGQLIAGEIVAADRQSAQRVLSDRQLYVVDLVESERRDASTKILRAANRAALLGQLAELLHAGVPLIKALTILADQAEPGDSQAVLIAVRLNISQGKSLAEALRSAGGGFDRLTLSMVQAGEEGGFLESALRRVAQYLEQSQDLQSRTLGALVYPMLLLSVSGLVVAGMLWFLIPRFKPIFSRLAQRGELPSLTTGVLWMSEAVRSNQWLILAALAVVLLVALHIPRARLRNWWFGNAVRWPLIGPILRDLAIARFVRVLGTLLTNGVPLLRSLQIAREVMDIPRLRAAIETAMSRVAEGATLVEPLSASGQIPRSLLEMIAVGEQSNQLDRVLIELADSLERQTHRRLEMLVRLVEPALLVLLAGLVLVLVIALLLPMLQLSGHLS